MSAAPELDATHDPALRSWVSGANDPACDFPPQHLPFGLFKQRGNPGPAALGIAIGDRVLSLAACASGGLLRGESADAARLSGDDALNRLAAGGRLPARALRSEIAAIIEEGNAAARRRADEITLALSAIELCAPVRVGDYSDFYASIHHATNVGSMFRPDNPLLPNYKYVPIGYHGRASSIVVSGTPIRRPLGQTRDAGDGAPTFGPSRRLDYELELGAIVGLPNALGEPVPLAKAEEHLWGVCLVNDWSARDIQSWEYQPLGPFLAKSFATSISPWVTPLDALAPFRAPAARRAPGDPAPLQYLWDEADQRAGAIDVTLEVWLRSARMRHERIAPLRLSQASFREMYWTVAQLLAHHTSNGCNLRAGDLIASGTVSGASPESRGSMLERAWRGTEPVQLPTGELRTFLEDGDEVVLRGFAERDGFRRVGLGECAGVLRASVRA